MRAACVLLGVSVVAGAGCLSLSVTDPSGSGGNAGWGVGGDASSSSSVGGSTSSSGGNGGAGGGCVSNTVCMTGKPGVCAQGLLSCSDPPACVQTVQPSAEKCDAFDDEDCNGNSSCTGTPTFSKGSGNMGTQGGTDVAVDSQGNVLVVGAFAGSIDLGGGVLVGAGGDDIFVAKFDASGNHIWSKRYGDAASQQARAIAVDADDNVFIGGGIQGTVTFGNDTLNALNEDAFIAKLDPDGNPLWAKYAMATGTQYFNDIAVDPSGDVIGVGLLQGTVNFGSGNVTSAGEDDILVAKFSKDGANLWTKSFGEPLSLESATGVATNSMGAIYMTGSATSAVNFGAETMSFSGGFDAFLVKLGTLGNPAWAKGFGDANDQYGTDVATDALGNVTLTITFDNKVNFGGTELTAASGTTDAAIAQFNSTGVHIWSKQFNATSDNTGVYIDTDDAANILVTGSFQGAIDFGTGQLLGLGTDMAFAKLDATGKGVFAQRYGSIGTKVVPLAVAAGKTGNAWVVGNFTGTVDFGLGAITANTADMFLAGFAP